MKLLAFLSYRVATRLKSLKGWLTFGYMVMDELEIAFRPAKHALDDIAVAITPSCEGMGLFAIDLVGDDRSDAPAFQPRPPMVGVIGLVGEEISRGGQVIGEHDRALDVGGLPWCQVEGERAAVGVTYGVDLSVTAAFGAANRLSRSPPFPPPAQRCALTWVVSMEISSGVPASSLVNAANRYCQMPRCDHRLKRL